MYVKMKRTSLLARGLGGRGNDYDKNDDCNDYADDDLHFHVFPELFLFDAVGGGGELLGAFLEVHGSVFQVAQLALSLQDLVDVAGHDALHLAHLSTSSLHRITVVLSHVCSPLPLQVLIDESFVCLSKPRFQGCSVGLV